MYLPFAVLAVVTVAVDFWLALPLIVTEGGENAQVMLTGAPIQLRSTTPANPLCRVTVNVKVFDPMAGIDREMGAAEMEKSAPVPSSDTDLGPLAALSTMDKVPVRLPAAVGLKVTWISQAVSAARLEPHALVPEITAKSPLALMLVMSSVAAPVLVRVTDCPALVVVTTCGANDKLLLESFAAGVGASPVPFKATVCGLLLALSVIDKVPVTAPEELGENVTAMVQVPSPARPVPQLFVWPNPAVTETLRPARAIAVLLVRVTALEELVVLSICLLKVRLAGDT